MREQKGKSKTGDKNKPEHSEPKPPPKISTPRIINSIVVIIIVIALIFLTWQVMNLPTEDEGPPLPPTTSPAPKLPTEGIINIHEHIQSYSLGEKWLQAMERCNVSSTVMLGSPDKTFLTIPTDPFNNYDRNNEDIVKLAYYYSDHHQEPSKFIAFPTVYTWDDNKLEKFQDLLSRGAWGLKLFTGHYESFYDHTGPLNATTMYPIFEYCQEESISIMWHINLGEKELRDEFEAVLKDFPELIIDVPHWGLRSSDLPTLEYFFDKYQNLYTDISFGRYAEDGFFRVSNYAENIKAFVEKYQDRIMFGTDMVLTNHPRKTIEWAVNLTLGYQDMLEKKWYNLTVYPDITGDYNGPSPGDFNGLGLNRSIVDKIYYDNAIKFLLCKPYYAAVNFEVIKTGETPENLRVGENMGLTVNGIINDQSMQLILAPVTKNVVF